MAALIECIPNISEGQRMEVLDEIREGLLKVPALKLLGLSPDTSHNRTVITMLGDREPLLAAIEVLYRLTLKRVDLRQHKGEHPRLGAVDVVPFIPIRNVTMDQCVELAKQAARLIWESFSVPVYLYEEAASRPERKDLPNIRKGEFEGLAEKMKNPAWVPDFGAAEPHPSAGASVVGARPPLIAYNINLGTDRFEVADRIAKSIRFIGGGFRFVRAMGVALDDRKLVQVSINMVNFKKTPLFRVFETVKREAARYGVNVVSSEIVGFVPEEALLETADFYLQFENFDPSQVLERKIAELES
ncbi:MAG: glutamate formimidoyltransferase [Acidobacteriota bacterium]